MTAWCLDPTHITKCWVSSVVMLCQTITAAVFGSCLFLGSFCLQQAKCTIRFKWGDWLGRCCTLKCFAFKKRNGLLSHYALSHCPSVLWSAVQLVWKHLALSELIIYPWTLGNLSCCFCQQLYLPIVTCPSHNTSSTLFHRWDGMLQIMSSSFPSWNSSLLPCKSLSYLSVGCCF